MWIELLSKADGLFVLRSLLGWSASVAVTATCQLIWQVEVVNFVEFDRDQTLIHWKVAIRLMIGESSQRVSDSNIRLLISKLLKNPGSVPPSLLPLLPPQATSQFVAAFQSQHNAPT